MSTDETENIQQLCGASCNINTADGTNSVLELNKLLESALRMSTDDTIMEIQRRSESLNNDKNGIREGSSGGGVDDTASWRVDTARRLCSVSIMYLSYS